MSQRRERAYGKGRRLGLEGQEGLDKWREVEEGLRWGSGEWKRVPGEGGSTWTVPESGGNVGYARNGKKTHQDQSSKVLVIVHEQFFSV